MEFHLYGGIGYAVGSCHDDRNVNIDEKFDVPDGPRAEGVAIEKARGIVETLHKKYSHLTDYGLSAELAVVKKIWRTHFEDDQAARAAQQAKKAKAAIPAHFEEKLF
jgi:hypothetical protein